VASWQLAWLLVNLMLFITFLAYRNFILLGARPHVSQKITEFFSEEQPGELSITTATTVTFTFDNNIPDLPCTCICDTASNPTIDQIMNVASVAMEAAVDGFVPDAPLPPSSPSTTIIEAYIKIYSHHQINRQMLQRNY
jgi:hypothetical protein